MVTAPPRVTLDPARQEVSSGDNANIVCSAAGQQPMDLQWAKKGTRTLPDSVTVSGGLLQFNAIDVRYDIHY